MYLTCFLCGINGILIILVLTYGFYDITKYNNDGSTENLILT